MTPPYWIPRPMAAALCFGTTLVAAVPAGAGSFYLYGVGFGGGAATTNGEHAVQIGEIKKKAEEAYSGINDALSELRTNILLAKDLVAEHGKAVPDHDAARTLEDAINVSVDRTEDAKGLLRALREVIES